MPVNKYAQTYPKNSIQDPHKIHRNLTSNPS